MKIKITLLLLAVLSACFSSTAQITATITVSPGTTVCDTMPVTFNLNIAGSCTLAYKVHWIVNNFIRDSCTSCTSWTTNLYSSDTLVYCNVNCNPMGMDNSNGISMTVNTCEGIEEYTNGTQLILYPNPSQSKLTIDMGKLKLLPSVIHIFDINGRAVNASYEIQDRSAIVNVGEFEDGIYYYRIIDKDGKKSATGKFVISK